MTIFVTTRAVLRGFETSGTLKAVSKSHDLASQSAPGFDERLDSVALDATIFQRKTQKKRDKNDLNRIKKQLSEVTEPSKFYV